MLSHKERAVDTDINRKSKQAVSLPANHLPWSALTDAAAVAIVGHLT